MTDTFSIASFNVLARCYSHPKFMPWVDPDVLDWDRRRNHLEAVYADCDASILCLQEVDETDFHMTALNRLGFETVYQARPEKQDGLLTAFRSEQFELFGDTHSIDFNDLCDFENANSEFASSDTALAPIVGVESRNPDRFRRGNVASLLPLRHVASGRRLLLANTHIYWNPRHEDVKLAQCRMLLHRIHVLRQQLLQLDNSPIAVVVAGDFNSLPSSLVYQFLIEGRCQPNTFLRPDAKLMLDHDKLKLVHYLRSIGNCFSRRIQILSFVNVVNRQQALMRSGLLIVTSKLCLTSALAKTVFSVRPLSRKYIYSILLGSCFEFCSVTRSRNAVRRAACPSYVLLPSADAELNFRQLVASFRFKVDSSTVYSKCIACNSRYEKVFICLVLEREFENF
jgi:endonuclease/exonuclease/phosphatase family metal-dependent hydrolase